MTERLPPAERYAPEPHAEFYARALHVMVRGISAVALVWRATVVVLVLMALTVLGLALWQASDRAVPVALDAQTLLTPAVAPRGQVRVRYAIERSRICAVDVSGVILDGADEIHPLVTLHRDALGPRGADTFTRSYAVPADARPGKARLRVTWAYVCPGNYAQALSPVILALPDVAFRIVARPRA